MTKRSLAAVFFLPILTFGIYGIYWWIVTFNEARKYTGDNSIPSGGKVFGFMLIPFFNFIWALLLLFSKVPTMVNKVEAKAKKPQTSAGILILLVLIPFVNVFYVTYVQSKLNKCID